MYNYLMRAHVDLTKGENTIETTAPALFTISAARELIIERFMYYLSQLTKYGTIT